MPDHPSKDSPVTTQLWALAGAPGRAAAVVADLELFQQAADLPVDGYEPWKLEVAREREQEEAAKKAAELPSKADESGYTAWKAEIEAAWRAFERRWGVPLGKQVRVQLRGEAREREGLLQVVEEPKRKPSKTALHLKLRLGGFVFSSTQIESVVRI